MTQVKPRGLALRLSLGSPTVVIRVYYSSYHLWAARYYAEEAARREAQLTTRPIFERRHRAHVTSSILSAVAFLEAAINEVFQDAAENYSPYIDPLSPEARAALAAFCEADVERKFSVLDKYQMALVLLGEPRFSKGAQPFQDAALLIQLRNELVHFRPGEASPRTFLRTLASKFAENPLMTGSGNSYFPDKCLGSGCAKWAAEVAITFADAFFGRVGIAPNYQLVGVASSNDL